MSNDFSADTATLHERIAELEVQIAALHRQLARSADSTADAHQTDQLALYKALVDNAMDAIAVSSPDAVIVYANPAFERIATNGQAAAGRSALSLYPPAVQEFIQSELAPVLFATGTWHGTLDMVRPDGHNWQGLNSSFVIYNAAGEPLGQANILRDVTAQNERERQLRLFEALVEDTMDGIVVIDLEGQVIYTNTAFDHLTDYGAATRSMHIGDFYAPEAQADMRTIMGYLQDHGTAYERQHLLRADGHLLPVSVTGLLLSNQDGSPYAIAGIYRDMSAEEQAEAERLDLQAQVIAAQEAAIRELSAPLIPLADGVVALPLVGTLDSTRAQQVLETLLEGVAAQHARVVLIDVTGVRVIDTQVANALLQVAQAVRLLGAQVVLTGMQPAIAQTIVALGIDLSAIITCSTLQAGIAMALHTRDPR